jgi:hypothetical protein
MKYSFNRRCRSEIRSRSPKTYVFYFPPSLSIVDHWFFRKKIIDWHCCPHIRKKLSKDSSRTVAYLLARNISCILCILASFKAIQRQFMLQTCEHLIQQYPDCNSRTTHECFVLALTSKYPALKYLDTAMDGKNGRPPYVSVLSLNRFES